MHNNHSVVMAAGGSYEGGVTVEVLDYMMAGNNWEQSISSFYKSPLTIDYCLQNLMIFFCFQLQTFQLYTFQALRVVQ